MSILIDLRSAIRGETRWLCAERGLDPDVARRMLRIEVSHDKRCALLMAWLDLHWLPTPYESKPFELEGVSIYVVPHDLPECGWRIINPMRKDAA